MSSDRSIAEDRTLQCACGEWFDVVEWQVIDVARRLDLVLEIVRGKQRTHRCPTCGVAQARLTQLGLMVPWDWIALVLTRDFDADLSDPAMARAQIAITHGEEPADGYAGALQILGGAPERR
jgi:CpXC protein